MKKLVSIVLVLVISLSCLSMSAFAVSSDDAIAYSKVLKGLREREIYGANSYLVDFDGDGRDELLIIHDDFNSSDSVSYEVYRGESIIAQERLEGIFAHLSIMEKSGSNKLYLVGDTIYGKPTHGDPDGMVTYTVENGSWVREDYITLYWTEAMEDVYHINDVAVSREEYDNARSLYSIHTYLNGKHSEEKQLLNAIDLTVSGYKDVYSSLTASEKKTLFDDFLYDVAVVENFYLLNNFDSKTATDEQIAFLFECLRMDTDFPIRGGEFTEGEFDELTTRYLGRTIDYSKFEIYHQPTLEDYGYDSVYYNGKFYLCWPQRGSSIAIPDMGKDARLYELIGNKYYAVFKMELSDNLYGDIPDNVYGAIVTKNSDGTYRLDRIGLPLTKAELDAFVSPSDWAKAEIEAAEKEKLIPELDGTPFMTENATRLQFAQLAVNLAEKITGKEISAAPSSTFKDCDDEAVLKAYKAGIINGTSATEFSPNQPLSREQLATMLWRTINYIQDTTKKEKLTAGGDISGYSDANSVSDYAKEAVAALAKNEVMKGTSETELSPKGACTVEQSVILVYRVFGKIK